MKKGYIFGVLFLIAFSLNAQKVNQTSGLSPTEIKEFHGMVEHMIERFQSNLSILGSKTYSNKVKETYRNETLKDFIYTYRVKNQLGNDYVRDKFGNVVFYNDTVHMQVSSIKNRKTTISTHLLTKYLKDLVALPYAVVEIKSAETPYISNIYKVGDHYEATATIFQRFCGYYMIEGRKVAKYCDVTTKTIKIYLIIEEDYQGKKWVVKLGDIDVAETVEY